MHLKPYLEKDLELLRLSKASIMDMAGSSHENSVQFCLRGGRPAPTSGPLAVPVRSSLFPVTSIPYSFRSPFKCHLTRERSPDCLCNITLPMPSLHFIFVIAPASRSPTFCNVSAPLTGSKLDEHGWTQGPFVYSCTPLPRIVTSTCTLGKYWSHECIVFNFFFF